MRWFFILGVLGAALLGFAAFLAKSGPEGNPSQQVTVVIKPGTSSYQIAEQLAEEGVLSYPWVFLIAHWLTYPRKPLIAGEYAFAKNSSGFEIANQMQEGRVVIRKFTIPEGWTVAQVVASLEQIECLTGTIQTTPFEGSLLPETYLYVYGEDRQVLVNRMQKAMQQQLNQLWQTRQSDDRIIQTPEMALALASIIEKETAIKSERGRIAGVFMNRLRLKMPLQSDPTVIYALTLGKKSLDRPLSRADLSVVSDYNTYRVIGIPPGPIACPGKESLKAVLNPESSEALYFVANGSGGHTFSQTLDQHNRHVASWRRLNRFAKKGE